MSFMKAFRRGREEALTRYGFEPPRRRPQPTGDAEPHKNDVAAQLAELRKTLERIVRKLDL